MAFLPAEIPPTTMLLEATGAEVDLLDTPSTCKDQIVCLRILREVAFHLFEIIKTLRLARDLQCSPEILFMGPMLQPRDSEEHGFSQKGLVLCVVKGLGGKIKIEWKVTSSQITKDIFEHRNFTIHEENAIRVGIVLPAIRKHSSKEGALLRQGILPGGEMTFANLQLDGSILVAEVLTWFVLRMHFSDKNVRHDAGGGWERYGLWVVSGYSV